MSNHEGGRLLNNVILKLDEKGVFEFLGKEETHKFLKEIVNLAQRTYDCNSEEILEGYTSRFQICYICLESSENLLDGLCAKCAGELQ
jgi:hypothetical protein